MAVISFNSNLLSARLQRDLGASTERLGRSFERLSSGLRINQTADDAAALAVASSLQLDSRVYSQGIRNLNDGISALNVAEGALTELSSITVRLQELATQASNGVLSVVQRQALNAEADELVSEFNRISQSTSFNEIGLLDHSTEHIMLAGSYGENGTIGVELTEQLVRRVGDGTFDDRSASSFSTGLGQCHALDAGDIDNDGDIDIVKVGNAGLAIIANNGSGSFSAVETYGTLLGMDVELEDLDEDGWLDILVASSNSAKVWTLVNNGDGTFAAAVSYANGPEFANSLITGDFNGDGHVDAVTANLGDFSVRLLAGDGTGALSAGWDQTIAAGASSGQAGDFNSDGNLDFAVTVGGLNQIRVFHGDGGGSFSHVQTVAAGGAAARLVVGDFNRDGYADLASANGFSNSISIFSGDRQGLFTLDSVIATTGAASTIAASDFDGDGLTDLVAGSLPLTIYTGQGDGTFEVGATFSTGMAASDLAVSDYDSDGALDVASVRFHAENYLRVRYGDSQETTSIGFINIVTAEQAQESLAAIESILDRVSLELAGIGASQSRLETALANLVSGRDNFETAASQILSADIAEETSLLVREQILQKSESALLAQANQQPAIGLKLLGSIDEA